MSAKDAVKAREDAKWPSRAPVVEPKKPKAKKLVETPEGLDALEYEVPLGDS